MNYTHTMFRNMRAALLASFIFSISIFQIPFSSVAQTSQGSYTPGGYLDSVTDMYGVRYSLGEIAINDTLRSLASGGAPSSVVVPTTCSPGYFRLYLDVGSGFENYATNDTDAQRLAVLCQVLTDVSNFIASPCWSTGQKVNLWVRSTTSGVILGVGTPFFIVPGLGNFSGIADNTAWITINSGEDAFIGAISPLVVSGGGGTGSSFFHGSVAFNWGSDSIPILWHYDLTTPPGAGETDFYTVALHEVLHVLGFASLIDYDGQSIIGAHYPFYTRYDQHLRTHGGVNLLTSSSGCDLYWWGWNAALDSATFYLSPDSCRSYGSLTSDFIDSSKALYYNDGVENIPVFTPGCYVRGSSLSHFDDQCYVPDSMRTDHPLMSSFNLQYFVMSVADPDGPYAYTTDPGAMKRALKPEEKQVLCDIGYTVGETFGSATYLNYINYGTDCPGFKVAGICDGVSGGTYTYMTTGAAININSPGLLSNDYGADSFKCLYEVVGNGSSPGTFSATGGRSATSIMYTPGPGAHGVQLLCYIPYNSSTGKEGNITYVFVYVEGSCPATPCSLVSNGEFEDYTESFTCVGCYTGEQCWSMYSGSPDIFIRGESGYGIPNFTFFCCDTPQCDVYNYPATSNNYFTGLFGYEATPEYYAEGINQSLPSPLIGGNTYYVSCWAKMADAPLLGWSTLPGNLQFAISASGVVMGLGGGGFVYGLPAGLTPLCDFNVIHPDYEWHYYSDTVTLPSGVVGNTLVILNATYNNPSTYPPGCVQYIAIDAVNIQPAASVCTFRLPTATCSTADSFDMRPYTCGYPGTFNWYSMVGGVRTLVHDPIFNPALAAQAARADGDSGLVTVCFDYNDSLGCSQEVCSSIQLNVGPIIGYPAACTGAFSAPLTDGMPGGTWSSSNVAVATIGTTGVIHGVSAGTCAITYSTVCGSAFVTATVFPSPGVFALTDTGVHCVAGTAIDIGTTGSNSGISYQLYDNGVASGLALTGSGLGLDFGLRLASGIYTAMATNTATGCHTALTGSVTIHSAPGPIIGSTTLCAGSTTPFSDTAIGGAWTSANIIVAMIGSSSGVATGLTAGSAVISYTLTDGCFTTTTLTVNPLPGTYTVTGGGAYCAGGTGLHVGLTGSQTGVSYQLYFDGSAIGSPVTGTGGLLDFGSMTGGGVYTVKATYIATGCTVWMSGSILIVVNPAPAPIAGDTMICAATGTATLTDIVTGGQWISGNSSIATVGTGTGIVTAVASGSVIISYIMPTGCQVTGTITVLSNTDLCSPCTWFGSLYSIIGGSRHINTSLGAGYYYLPNSATIEGAVTMTDAVILVAPGDTLYVDTSSSLTLSTSHLFSCNMWQGVVLKPGVTTSGRFAATGNSLIEDAMTGVYANKPVTMTGSLNIDCDAAIFNRCYEGIEISYYNSLVSSYPFLIRNTVITSKDFSAFWGYPANWPSPAMLKTPYSSGNIFDPPFAIQTYTGVSCKNGAAPYIGIQLDSVGADTPNTQVYSGVALPTYYAGVTIGDTTRTTANTYLNLIDNTMYGVYAVNSNVDAVNNAFTNIDSRYGYLYPRDTIYGGDGIYALATSDYYNHDRLRVWSPGGNSYRNSFYGFTNGVACYNYFHVIGQQTYMINKTTGVTSLSSPGSIGPTGSYGFLVQSAKYDTIDISSDSINNVFTGIGFWALQDPVRIGYCCVPAPWQYTGRLNITSNVIQPNPQGFAAITGTQQVWMGIAVQNILSQVSSGYPGVDSGLAHIDLNDLVDVYDGIYVNNFYRQQISSNSNNITLRPFAGHRLQYGVNHTLCRLSQIDHNYITADAAAAAGNDSMRACYASSNVAISVKCNSETGVGRGYEFFLKNLGAGWYGNYMSNGLKGLVLNGSLIGTQRGPTGAIWDQWLTGIAAETYVYNGANAIYDTMFVIGGGDQQPVSNIGFPYASAYSTINGSIQVLTHATGTDSCLNRSYGLGMSVYEQVTQQQILYPGNVIPNNWIGQYAVWQNLILDSTLVDSSGILAVFDSMAQNSRFAYLTSLDALIAQGNFDSAQVLLGYNIDSMANTSTDSATQVKIADGTGADFIVQNYQRFYGLYMKYIMDTLAGSDSLSILGLASLCPEVNGTVVYQARALYSAVFNDLSVFNDDSCMDVDSTYSAERHTGSHTASPQNTDNQGYVLYPNPNSGQFTVQQLVPDSRKVNVEIYDVLGRLIYKNDLSFVNSRQMLTLSNLIDGSYFIKLTDFDNREFRFVFIVK